MRIIFLFIFFLLVFGCTNTPKAPENILPKKKMELVLWDMIQAERFSTFYLQRDSAAKDVQLEKFKLYDQIFSIHKISKEDFITSYKYYLSRPDIAKPIFDSMVAKAERQKIKSYQGGVK
jgi:Domain of unknown function (DUF4296)